jgi:tetratricopeptide (TPR) repeat protein
MAQLYFIVAARLNYPAAMCDEIGALSNAAAGAKPYPLKVVINNADCLRKNGKVKQANAEFAKAVAEYQKTDPDGVNTPLLDYRALRGLATTSMALPDVAEKAENDRRMQAAIDQLGVAAKLSKANGEIPSQQQSIRGNMGIGYLRMGLYNKAIDHSKGIDAIYPGVWNLTVQAIAANKVGDSGLERTASEKLHAFRRQQFNECELQLLLGPNLAPQLDPILKKAQMADVTPACPKVT